MVANAPENSLLPYKNLATNVRRAMARLGLTQSSVLAVCGIDERTLRGVLYCRTRAHELTLRKLAAGLGMSRAALLSDPALLTKSGQTVREALGEFADKKPHLFARFEHCDFDELVAVIEAGKVGAA